MLRTIFISAIIIISQIASAQPEKVWETGDLKTPESVYYYETDNVVFVSNINGKPTDKDNNGFITKMNTDGKIIKLKWAEGLHAPKGMVINRGYLYVTDINRIAKIDLKEGSVEKYIPVAGSQFLNDMEAYNGRIFVSDMKANKLYVIENDKPTIFKETGLKGSNGLYEENGMLYVGNNNYILSIDLNSEEPAAEKHEFNVGGIDGLKKYAPGEFLTSDWQGNVYHVKKGGDVKRILSTVDKEIQAADFEYIQSEKLLFIPTFFHNTVSAYRLD